MAQSVTAFDAADSAIFSPSNRGSPMFPLGPDLDRRSDHAFTHHRGAIIRFRDSDHQTLSEALGWRPRGAQGGRSALRQRHVDRRERVRAAGWPNKARLHSTSVGLAEREPGNDLLAARRDCVVNCLEGGGRLGTRRGAAAEGDDYTGDQNWTVI